MIILYMAFCYLEVKVMQLASESDIVHSGCVDAFSCEAMLWVSVPVL